jgi:Glyoxalase-like domain
VIGDLECVVLDCPDVLVLAEFYRALLGGVVNEPDPRWAVDQDFATLHTGPDLVLAFQRVTDYAPAQCPDSGHPQQFHLDIRVADLDQAQIACLDLGAALLTIDPRGGRVYADPAGHPFCLLPGPQQQRDAE